jgi:hypothetical protein
MTRDGESLPGGRLPTLLAQYAMALHVVNHDGPCGERIPSPHPRCQAAAAPFLAAERVTIGRSSIGPVRVVMIRCHGCGVTWNGTEATS